mgnify:CR=1 FL=1
MRGLRATELENKSLKGRLKDMRLGRGYKYRRLKEKIIKDKGLKRMIKGQANK